MERGYTFRVTNLSEGGASPAKPRDQLSAQFGPIAAAWPAIALAALGAAILFVHVPVLRSHYFIGDDFVPLADIASRSAPAYIRDLFLLNDTTPNWRFLSGLAYLGLYRVFGLHAFPFFLASLLVHIATAGLIYRLVRRATNAAGTGLLAAAFFALTSAHAHTVGLVTAFNNILAAFLVMLSLVLLYEGLERRKRWWLIAAPIAFFGAVAANESAAVLAPVPVLFVLWRSAAGWRQPTEWPRLALLTAPFVLIAASTLIALGACGCTEATRGGVSSWGWHANGNAWIYLGRLLYPVGLETPGDVGTAHLVAGITLLVLLIIALVHGPALARIAVAFLVLALVPYLPIHFAMAPRYVYMAAVPFSMLAALYFAELARYGSRLTPVAPAALLVIALGVIALYSWQTWEQDDSLEHTADQWRTLVYSLNRSDDIPAGARVYVRGGPVFQLSNQFVVLPAVGELRWPDVELFEELEGTTTFCAREGAPTYVLDYDRGRYDTIAVIPAEGVARTPYHFPPPIPAECSSRVSLP